MLRALLGRLSDDALAESIVGDLEEQRRHRTGSRLGAFAWYVIAMAGIVSSLSLHKLREAPTQFARFGRGLAPRAEVRQALRSLRSAPWYAAAAVSVIALSLALAATVFAIVDGVLFMPVPYPNPDRLFAITAQLAGRPSNIRGVVVARADVTAWSAALPDAVVAAFNIGGMEIVGENEGARSAGVDARFFDAIGVHPMIGQFAPTDFGPYTPIRPALLTYPYWQTRFGGDPSVMGRTFSDGRGRGIEVRGILPPEFVFPDSGAVTTALLTPLDTPRESSADQEGRYLKVLVRLPGSRSVDGFQQRAAAAMKTRAEARPVVSAPDGTVRPSVALDRVSLQPIRLSMTGSIRVTAWTVFWIATSLLILACLNVTGLSLARVRDRARDLDLRRALGAGTSHLVRLLIVENGIVVVAGSALGMLLAYPMLATTLALMPNLMLVKTPALDIRVAIFGAIASGLCVMAVTLWPARAVGARSLRASLAEAGGTTRRARLGRTVLVACQVALAFAMTVGGALVVGSLARVWGEDVGFDVDRRAVLDIGTPEDAPGIGIENLLATLQRMPGVERVGGLDKPLLRNAFNGSWFDTPAGVVERTTVESMSVTSGFFEAAGISPIEGRLPSAREFEQGAHVAVVSKIVAEQYWPGRPAIGQILVWNKRPFSVVGVVTDARYVALDREPQGAVYVPLLSNPEPYVSNLVVAFKPGSALGIADVVTRLKEECPRCAIDRANTMTQAMSRTIRIRQFRAWLFGAFGIAALIIVGIGILGLVAMTTSRRTKEVGIRMTVGATRADVLRLLLREQTTGVLMGLAVGGVVAAWAVRYVSAYLYETPLHDPLVWSASMLILLAIAVAGTLIPAARASRVDPVKALRVE
ncbi:MAG TPA: ABC transporter permease [Vicinamibacterales bacterium]